MPEKGWPRRNVHYLSKNVVPALFNKRAGESFLLDAEKDIRARENKNSIWVNWIGHASFWIKMGNYSFMIDPNWAMWHGPIKRMRLPGVPWQDFPSLDYILVTHAHFDHLHKKSLRKLTAERGIVVPQGCVPLVKRLGFDAVHELRVGESLRQDDIDIILTKTAHWGARLLHDTHRAHGSYIVQVEGKTLFHGGDSAYFEGFSAIGNDYAIDVALLPIGAYGTPSGRSVHMNPEEALQAFIDLKARWFIPMHYDTFPLGTEPLGEALSRLIKEAHRLGIAHKIIIPQEGVGMSIEMDKGGEIHLLD